jgi:hypothetical protein
MILDAYTKAILTVIAVSLAVLAASSTLRGPNVAEAQGLSCGSAANPCYLSLYTPGNSTLSLDTGPTGSLTVRLIK